MGVDSPQNHTLRRAQSHQKVHKWVAEATSKDRKLDISRLPRQVEAGDGWGRGVSVSPPLELFRRPKKAGGWHRRHGTGPDKIFIENVRTG